MPLLTLPPATPSRMDPTNFSVRMDAYLAWFSSTIPSLNSMLAGTNDTGSFLNISVSGTAQFANGTEALPSMAFASDLDVGFYRVGANQIGLSTAGTRRLLCSTTALTVNLPIEGTAVTQTSTDQTAKRLLKVGDFGIGKAVKATAAVNLNTFVTPGSHTLEAVTVTNGPSGVSGTITALVNSIVSMNDQTDGRIEQKITVTGTMLSAIGDLHYRRSKDGAGWSPWTCDEGLYQEHASNGWSIQMPNGMMICGHDNISGTAVNVASGAIFTSAAISWTFPKPFVGNHPDVMIAQVGNAAVWGVCNTKNLNSANFRLFSGVSQASGPVFGAVAIGPWATGIAQ